MAAVIEFNLADVLNRLARGAHLTRAEAADALRAVMTGTVSENPDGRAPDCVADQGRDHR